MRFSLLFLLGMALASTLAAQEAPVNALEVYPVRVNHKWGYVKWYGSLVDTVVAPRYDYIADINLPWNHYTGTEEPSPYRIFELDGKVGLLDYTLQEILPNHYNRIRALTTRYFAVEINNKFQLIDIQKNTLLDSAKYDDIIPADITSDGEVNYFLVKKGDRWGVHTNGGGLGFEPKYAVLLPAGKNGYFKAKLHTDEKNWRLLDTQGQQVIKNLYMDFKLLDENWIGVNAGFWKLMRRTDARSPFETSPKIYQQLARINNNLAATVSKDSFKIQLWHIPTQKWLRSDPIATEIVPNEDNPNYTYYPWYEPLDDQFALYKISKGSNKLVNNEGKILPSLFHEITASGIPGVYFVNFRNDWGIIAPATDSLPIVDYYYDEIFPFKNDIAICRKGSKYGAYVLKNGQLDSIPCMFEYLTLVENNKLWVPSDENIVQYKVNEQGKFEIDTLLVDVFSVAYNTTKANVEAPSQSFRALPSYQPIKIKEDIIQVKQMEDSTLIIKMHTVVVSRTESQFIPKWQKKLKLEPRLAAALEVTEDQLLAFYQKEKRIRNNFTQMLSKGALQCVRFYNMESDDFASPLSMLGFRAFDTLSKYTAFIDTDGKMGIITRQGTQVLLHQKPVRYTYIGPFIAGLARAYVGGELIIEESDELKIPAKFEITDQFNFIKEFNIKEDSISIFIRGQKSLYATGGKWVYINTNGDIILEPDADYIDNFHPNDHTALILKTNQQEVLGNPDADYGVINKSGKIIIPVKYANIIRDKDYFLLGQDGTPTFYFNKKGHQIFENPTRLRPFSEGLALFMGDNERWGYVDTNGVVVIPPQYKIARPFSDGLAFVVGDNGHCLFIDNKGVVAFQTPFKEKQWRGVGDFHNGRCWFKQSGSAWIWGCYNKKGDIIIPAKYFYTPSGTNLSQADEPYLLPMDFSHGVAAVNTLDENNRKVAAIIDTSENKLLISKDFDEIFRFDEQGYAVFRNSKSKLQGLFNYKGDVIIPLKHHQIKPFINGYAKVGNNNGKWGLVNQQGKEIIPVQYVDIDTVSEGLVAVKAFGANSWMVVDTNHQMRMKGPFERIRPFKEGLSFVTSLNRSKIINTKGEEVIFSAGKPIFFAEGLFGMNEPARGDNKPERFFYADAAGNNLFGRFFGSISEHQLGVATVAKETTQSDTRRLLGAINNRGVLIVPLKYNTLHIQPDGNIIINPQRFYGLADKNGQILLNPEYDRISRFYENGIFRVERGEKVGYVSITEGTVEWIWALTN